jgi:DegV family protein with EDD domain
VIEPRAVSSAPRTAVVTDSTAYLPQEMIDEHGIGVVSLYVTVDGEQQAESEVADYGDFYDRLRTSESGATTSQPSVGDFVSVYEPLLEDGAEVVSVHISAGISGTCEAAGQARERLVDEGKGGERIHVIDSQTAAGALGLCVLAGAGAQARGAGAEEVAARVAEARSDLKIWFAVDTLEYLRRGGRIGGARALIGSALKIKPILTLEGVITPIEKVRTRARAIERLRDYARQRHESNADAWVVQHIRDPEAAAELAGECREIFGRDAVFVSEIGPVIGAHVGPGVLGVGSVPAAMLE